MTIEHIKILAIGAGSRGWAYTMALKECTYAKITGVADISANRRNSLIAAYAPHAPGIPVAEYSSHTEALEHLDKYDAVIIAVLDDLHCEVALACANAGKPMLCEKPLATTWQHCKAIIDSVLDKNLLFALGHVLRYSSHNIKIKEILDSGVLGEILNVNHTEPVGYWHFAHSFVRGNWSKTSTTTFALMSKCCHDIDLLLWFLGADNIKRVQSFGSLSHFKKSRKPIEAGDATKCVDCSYEQDCAYSAVKTYIERPQKFAVRNLTDIEDIEHITKAIQEGPYGRCVYECDNDVCDNQTVNLDFGDTTATMTMVATSEKVCERKICIYGSKGELTTDSTTIHIFDYATNTSQNITTETKYETGHGGGDTGLAYAFVEGLKAVLWDKVPVQEAQKKYIRCTPQEMLMSHRVVFLAEQSRLNGVVSPVTF